MVPLKLPPQVPVTGEMLYVFVFPGHTLVLPPVAVIAPGTAGLLSAILSFRCALLPQLLFAFTEMDPVVLPTVTVILFVVDVPDQPDGSDHV